MAIIKCKMCGGDMELSADKTFGTCEFCGCTMTLPKVDDEQRANAFNRGNHFRRIGEFDKALAVYERIVREDERDAEAHWCCALCRFGIEYVEDPATYEWFPTCHRASFDSFLEDVDYKAALEHSDGITRRQYMKDAAKIAEVQRGILATSQNAEPYDVFICYKESDEHGGRTKDSLMAQDIYYQLTEQGRKVFFARITLEDVAGTQYEPYIFAALNSAKVMIVVGTKPEHLNAVWVKNEWSRFLAMMKKDRSKLLLPCYRDMDPYDLPEQLSVLQSYDMAKIGFIQDLTRGIAKVLDADKKPEPVKETVVVQQSGSGNVTALLKRGSMALEDRDWEKADGFFEDVLNQDAECAEAYLGKFLMSKRCSSLKAYLKAWKYSEKPQMKYIPKSEAHVEEMVNQYHIPGFLDKDTIRDLYNIDRGYTTCAAGAKEARAEAERFWQSDKNLVRAARFASGDTARELTSGKESLLASLDVKIREAEAAEEAACRAAEQKYAEQLAKADEKAEQLFRDGNARRETRYQTLLEGAKTENDIRKLKNLADALDELGEYKDSQALAEYCRRRIEEIQGELNRQAEEARKAAEAEAERQRLIAEKEEAQRKAKNKKMLILAGVALAVVLVAILLVNMVVIPSMEYRKAEEALASGNIAEAAILFGTLGDYQDARERSFALWHEIAVRETISAGSDHTVGLKADGTVVAVGRNEFGQCDVDGWTDIVAVSAGGWHTVGLKADGTVVATGSNEFGRCNVEDWTDIVAISAGNAHTVGLKADGTVVATGYNNYGQCDVRGWTNIVAVSAGYDRSIGMTANGPCVITMPGDNSFSQSTAIVAIDAGDTHIVALKADGTVWVTQGQFDWLDDSEWTDLVAVSAGTNFTVGLKNDGTVIALGDDYYDQCDVEGWTDIVAISAGAQHTVGLRSDGTVVTVGSNYYGKCDVSGWTDIKIPE